MKECERIQEMIIDSIYGKKNKEKIENHIRDCAECRKFAQEMGMVFEKMEALETDIPVSRADIFSALETAENIKEGKKCILETVGFIAASVVILSLLALLTITEGVKFIAIIQILFLFNLPVILIPVLRSENWKGESK